MLQTIIICHNWSTGRDPKNFRNPEKFNPHRWLGGNRAKIKPFASLPFSLGQRMCIGKVVQSVVKSNKWLIDINIQNKPKCVI